MNARRDRLKSLLSGEDTADISPVSTAAPSGAGEQRRVAVGAVKAMGLSLGSLSQEVEEARRLRDALATGEQVVELDPGLLERSPFVDRLGEGVVGDPDFEALKRSLAEHGQQVPVLVRPHPDGDKAARGIYQIAYGHRRAKAAKELGRSVRAVVRNLSNDELALAQGKENAERRALSFIERAFFAKSLQDHGFDRATAQAALAVHKSEMSRLLQVADAVPLNVVQAIGPAPKAGRPRWMALGGLLSRDKAGLAREEMASRAFVEADSDARFQRLFNRLKAAEQARSEIAQDNARQISGPGGVTIGELAKAGDAMRLTIPASAGRGFADYIAARLPELHALFSEAAVTDNE